MQLLPHPQRNVQPAHLKAVQMHEDEDHVGLGQNRERVFVFIDGASLFYAALQLRIEINYTKLLQRLSNGRSLIRAYFYTGVDSNNPKQQNFLAWMRRNGYRVVAKELVQYPDGSKKANLEIELAIDMLTLAGYCDTVVLLSGNGELSYVVSKVVDRGVQVELVSLPVMVSNSLRNTVDRFIDLTTFKSDIQRDPL
jgi:uncharacterized LabA/DUF88 family protein